MYFYIGQFKVIAIYTISVIVSARVNIDDVILYMRYGLCLTQRCAGDIMRLWIMAEGY